MFDLSLLPTAALTIRLAHALPMLVSVCLVYAATRHEEIPAILHHAWRFGVWVLTFMLGIAGVVMLCTWWVD